MKASPFILAAVTTLAAAPSFAVTSQTVWPNAGAQPTRRFGEKAFTYEARPDSLAINFNDVTNSDDYIAIDIGHVNLAGFEDGGYIEIEAEIDQPVLRITPTIAEPADFWNTRQTIEGGAPMRVGRQTYRFYLDGLATPRAQAAKDDLYIFIQDFGGQSRGAAQLKITRVALKAPIPTWRKEKVATYATQYNWPKVENIEGFYKEQLTRGVNWSEVASSPTLRSQSLNGPWKKKFFGEKTWDYAFLTNDSFAKPGFDDSSWTPVTTPEAPVPNQTGGHFWYRRQFTVQPASLLGQNKIYLRLDDVADDARIYLNGRLVGTQASAQKRLDWVAENGSRSSVGIPVEKNITWKHFDRVGIPFPFDRNAVPKDQNRLLLPLYSGQEDWPLAYDVTDLIKPGVNTIALRVYGNPMQGWWIYRHRDDRSAKNIFGILGSATLAIQPRSVIASLSREPATTVAPDGQASHRFTCAVLPGMAAEARTVVFRSGTQEAKATVGPNSTASALLKFPAHFGTQTVQATVLDAQGNIRETRDISFDGSVIEISKGRLLLNGEPYFVRGINASPGVEWGNDRTVTRREFARILRTYQQLGLNTLRLDPAESWQLDLAAEYGIMVMPTTAAASTDWGIGIFGQLVNPDLQLAWDRQRMMALQLNRHANILLWNGGNEIHHTPGYDDRPALENYLTGIREAIRATDPVHRPVTFANLDMWRQKWFFTQGQDIIGWNVYKDADFFRDDLKSVQEVSGGRPILFTEWGMEKQSSRKDNLERWEKEMLAKWDLISNTPGSIGGMIYAWHGEMDDDRGRKFLRDMFQPFELTNQEGRVIFRNRSEATMRNLSFTVVAENSTAPVADFNPSLAPGTTYELRFLTPPPPGTNLEIRYETHGGLKHYFTQRL